MSTQLGSERGLWRPLKPQQPPTKPSCTGQLRRNRCCFWVQRAQDIPLGLLEELLKYAERGTLPVLLSWAGRSLCSTIRHVESVSQKFEHCNRLEILLYHHAPNSLPSFCLRENFKSNGNRKPNAGAKLRTLLSSNDVSRSWHSCTRWVELSSLT